MMVCLVKQPNAIVLEVEVDPKSKGQQCLDKVCQMLGIIEEDYFGLQYAGQHGEMLWLNMRNPIRQQLTGAPPYRLHLKVKFFVPPHLLLQESTRHQVSLNLIQDLQEGRLRTNDKALLIELTALIAQSEMGDLNDESSSDALLLYTKWLPFSLFESDLGIKSPLSANRATKRRKHHSGASEPETSSEGEELSCDHEMSLFSLAIASVDQSGNDNELPKLCHSVMQIHRKLKGTKPSHARYLFLQKVSNLQDFGVEYFLVKSNNAFEEALCVGVGPKGVTIANEDSTEIKHSIPYSSIHMATHSGRCFFLTYIEGNSDSHPLGFKLESCQAANAIYRSVTEKHAFYSCETVRNAVTSQFIRDLKGTIVSLFNENTALGKNYVFDIRRTCREVYDYTRRVLYQLEAQAKDVGESQTEQEAKSPAAVEEEEGEEEEEEEEMDHVPQSNDNLCWKSVCKNVQDKLATLKDSMLCRICMDSDVCTAFFPCRHVVCCSGCATLCDKCPLCRTPVQSTSHIYLPVNGNGLQQITCDDDN